VQKDCKSQSTHASFQSLKLLARWKETAKEIPEDPETQFALGLLWQSTPRFSVVMLSQAVGLPNMVVNLTIFTSGLG
jgi:hypothetical protein